MQPPSRFRVRGIVAWVTSWASKSDQNDTDGDLGKMTKSRSNIFDCEFKTTSPLQQAALKFDTKLVDEMLRESEDVTTDLMHTDNLGFSAFYYIMKNCPSSIESLLFDCIDFGSKENNYEIEVTFSSLSKKDQGIFFEELCKMKDDPSLKEAFEQVFLHPTTEAYFFERWSQLKYAYYLVPLFAHFMYSVAYSSYAIIVYRILCGASIIPMENDNETNSNEIRNLTYTTTLERRCDLTNSSPVEKLDGIPYSSIAIISWINVLLLTAFIILSEISKLVYYKSENNIKRYFWSLETMGYFWLIISVVLISFHQDPFQGEVVLQPFQYHAAALGVFSTWFIQMLLMRRIPKIGMFIEMIWPVSETFFQFFVGLGYLIVAFACSFYILFPDKYAFKNGLAAAFIKVFHMSPC